MTIHAADDGRILVKCFAGCSFEEIVNSLGGDWEPWFPPKQAEDFKPPIRRPFPAADVLEALAFECLVVAVSAEHMAEGGDLSKEAAGRLRICAQRIQEGRSLAIG